MDHQLEQVHPATPTRREMQSKIDMECNQSIELVLPFREKPSHTIDASISFENMNLSSKSWDDSIQQTWSSSPSQEVTKFDAPLILVTPKSSYEENWVMDDDNDGKTEDLVVGNNLRRLYANMVDDIKRSPAYSVCKDLLVAPSLVPVVHQNLSLQQRDTSDSSLALPHESLLLFSDDLGDDEHRIGHSPLRSELTFTQTIHKVSQKPLAFPVGNSLETQDGQRVVITRSPERKPLQPRPFMSELFTNADYDDPFE